ncbi:hypothetical protein ACRALDRAFT_1065908 [Sodiomyces alcalophilus JCM 7366]|uniref:uncharacterized protein n=1 Tax=Sodiomyces alcalophilus JCM 7366 TaxID=591952 RepID=UPI0039B381D0
MLCASLLLFFSSSLSGVSAVISIQQPVILHLRLDQLVHGMLIKSDASLGMQRAVCSAQEHRSPVIQCPFSSCTCNASAFVHPSNSQSAALAYLAGAKRDSAAIPRPWADERLSVSVELLGMSEQCPHGVFLSLLSLVNGHRLTDPEIHDSNGVGRLSSNHRPGVAMPVIISLVQ